MSHETASAVLAGLALFTIASALAGEQQPTPVDKQAVRVRCETTNYVMQPGQVDQAVVLTDPAHQQTVLFDIAEGGAMVSLKYHGIEHIWGYHGGALLQMAFHHNTVVDKMAGDYNPTQAGDGSATSPVTGIACQGTSSVDIVTMMLDFNHNNAFYRHPIIAVWGGRINDDIPLSYFTPYTLETRAYWVRNPGTGEAKYYLRLDQRLTHLTKEKIGSFTYDFADYGPWEFDVPAVSPERCPCKTSSTSDIIGGWYTDKDRKVGLAVAMPSSNFPDNTVTGLFISDYTWRNRSFHLESQQALDGIASKSFHWYVMVGPWRDALSFARQLGKGGAQ
jgi:hypothetical protein